MEQNGQGISLRSHLKRSENGRYTSLQGTYNPRIGGPYKGPSPRPKFRSKLELRLMLMLDSPEATNVLSWEYESRRIPYLDKTTFTVDATGRRVFRSRQYVVDFVIRLKNGGGCNVYWVEVKSVHDIDVNKRHLKTKNAAIAEQIRLKNYCKWMSAAKVAKGVGARFLVVTERELDQLKTMIFHR